MTDYSSVPKPALPTGPDNSGGNSAQDKLLAAHMYLGQTEVRYNPTGTIKLGVIDGDTITGNNLTKGPDIRTVASAQNQWFHWTNQMRLDLAKKLYAWGYIDSPNDIYGARAYYYDAIAESALAFQNGQRVTPLDILDVQHVKNLDKLKARTAAGPGSVTTPNPVMVYNKDNVAAMVTVALQKRLGRDPTEAEINTFYNAIHQHQLGDPGSETVVRGKDGKVISDITNQGFNDASAGQLIDSKIKDNPEYAQYQAATTYFNAAMEANQAIGGA